MPTNRPSIARITAAAALTAGLAGALAAGPVSAAPEEGPYHEAAVKLKRAPIALACPVTFPQACWEPAEGNVARAAVRIPHGIESIDQVCFVLRFEGDLVDPGERGESVAITFPGTYGFGWQNGTGHSVDTVTSCLAAGYHDVEIASFLDGRETISVFMNEGSATLASVAVTIVAGG